MMVTHIPREPRVPVSNRCQRDQWRGGYGTCVDANHKAGPVRLSLTDLPLLSTSDLSFGRAGAAPCLVSPYLRSPAGRPLLQGPIGRYTRGVGVKTPGEVWGLEF
ncbi:similar to An02g00700 [Aspergillus luchuensis]|uniref:Similar to An02g00700 n=1 Tax=Aspergillus kawachii TaxID=1069201 RepID=A0A146F6F3_ASPKA|nr:similar to An02g00700 [Aspergillus luchuensis]